MNLNTYLQQLDLAKLDLQPLNDHFIAEQLNEQEKELYLTMIASFVLVDDLTEQRTRLFQLYLHACKTNHQQGKIFNLAQNISKDQIKEFIRLCKDKALIESFFVDAFIFSRLDKPLTENLNNLFDEWICLFQLDDKVVETIIYFVSNTLGMKSQYQLNYILDIQKLNIWIPYCLEYFSLEKFKHNRAYYLDKNQEISCDFEIKNNIFVSKTDVIFKFSKIEQIHFNFSIFVNSRFDLQQVDNILIENCSFSGLYPLEGENNLFSIKDSRFGAGGEIKNTIFRNNLFEVKQCRALYLEQSTTIENCNFRSCGNELMVGGAICSLEKIKIYKTNFIQCVARVAGAIYTKKLSYKLGIESCIFENCFSLDYQDINEPKSWNNSWVECKYSDQKLNAGALYIDVYSAPTTSIKDSTFIASNIYLSKANHYDSSRIFYNCHFVDSILTVADDEGCIVDEKSTFDKGGYYLDSKLYQNCGDLKLDCIKAMSTTHFWGL